MREINKKTQNRFDASKPEDDHNSQVLFMYPCPVFFPPYPRMHLPKYLSAAMQ